MFDAVTAPTTPLPDDQRYEAFLARDRSHRDAFVIGVLTTGVYCRAGCPARAPKRENARFFETADGARAAARARARGKGAPARGAAPARRRDRRPGLPHDRAGRDRAVPGSAGAPG